jgi:3-oxoacyl-[acyl-carrier protein] reductase
VLENKVALVTGGTRGIGAAICFKLAESGADIVFNGTREEIAGKTINEVKKLGREVLFVKADVTKREDVVKLVDSAIKKFGKIDILVNNAGITRDALLLRMSEEEWDRVIAVNLKGVFNCSQVVVKYMVKARSGVIINVSSVVGLVGNAGQSNYAASKAGLIGFTKSLAKELASRGIRVNAVAPGFINTEMTAKLSEKIREVIRKKIPLGFFGDPIDVAAAVKFLASDEARYITGQVLVIDGGLFM